MSKTARFTSGLSCRSMFISCRIRISSSLKTFRGRLINLALEIAPKKVKWSEVWRSWRPFHGTIQRNNSISKQFCQTVSDNSSPMRRCTVLRPPNSTKLAISPAAITLQWSQSLGLSLHLAILNNLPHRCCI